MTGSVTPSDMLMSQLSECELVPTMDSAERNSALKALLTQVNQTCSSKLPSASTNTSQNKKGHIPRPMNAFMLWARRERKVLQVQRRDLRNIELSKILGEMWRQLPSSEKKSYLDKAEEIKAQHKINYPDYKYKPKRRKPTRRGQQQPTVISEERNYNSPPPSTTTTFYRPSTLLQDSNYNYVFQKSYPTPMTDSHGNFSDLDYPQSQSVIAQPRPPMAPFVSSRCAQCLHATRSLSWSQCNEGLPSRFPVSRNRFSLLTNSVSTPCVASNFYGNQPAAVNHTYRHEYPSAVRMNEDQYFYQKTETGGVSSTCTSASLQSPQSQHYNMDFELDLDDQLFTSAVANPTGQSLPSSTMKSQYCQQNNSAWSSGPNLHSNVLIEAPVSNLFQMISAFPLTTTPTTEDTPSLNDIMPSIGFD